MSCVLLIVALLSMTWQQPADAMERRRPQFPTDTGYYIFPAPYSLPGVGSGGALVGVGSNLFDSHTDIFGYALTGDLEGVGVTGSDIHLVPKHLILDLSVNNFNHILTQSYAARGIAGDKDDYTLLEFDKSEFYGSRLTGTFFDRMFEVYAMGYIGEWHLDAIRNPDGELIQFTQNADSNDFKAYAVGMRGDYTDDYQNPRQGVRLDITARRNAQTESTSPDQYVLQYSLTGYVALRALDTLVINYYQADAHVREKGETDPVAIQQLMGLDCSLGTATQQADCLNLVNNTASGNRYGTADGLGGTSRLRAFPGGRYIGAHTQFLGAEYRWNLTDESTPFNIWIAKDIRTAIQLAFFYEVGTVADRRGDMWDKYRSNYGIGARLVTASGVVIRADLANGGEGVGLTIIAGYPWESF